MPKATVSKNRMNCLHTPLGKRTMYDSVAHCNRCGLCASACPVYAHNRQESLSPRGRNQALRLLLEGKLKARTHHAELETIALSCTLCGQCTQVCPGQIPTAQHVLELRRRLHAHVLPSSLFLLLRSRAATPRLFSAGVRGALWLHHFGLLKWVGWLPGLSWVTDLAAQLPSPIDPPFSPSHVQNPTLIYLPSPEAQFLQPDVARHVLALANRKYRTQVWLNTPSGLFEYVYGDLARARTLVKRLIVRHARTGKGNLALVTDSLELYTFLQQTPALFEGLTTWQRKAEQLVRCVRFVTDLLPKKLPKAHLLPGPAMLVSTSLLGPDQPVSAQARQIMHSLFKKNFVQCEYTSVSLPPFGYGLGKMQAETGLHLQAVQTVARHQTRVVVVLSVGTALKMGSLLRRFYPSAQVCHIAQLTDNVCNSTTRVTN